MLNSRTLHRTSSHHTPMTLDISPTQLCQRHLLPGINPTLTNSSLSSSLDPSNRLMIRVAIKITWKAKAIMILSSKIQTTSWRTMAMLSSHVNRVTHLRHSNRSRTIMSINPHHLSSHKSLICSRNKPSSQLNTNSPCSRHPHLSFSLPCPRLPTTSLNTMPLT